MCGDSPTVRADQIECLRQVQLALGVVVAQPRQRRTERVVREHVHAGVHLADLQLLGCRVPVGLGLDHTLDHAVLVAHHPPIPARIVEHRARHRRLRAALRVGLYEL